MDESDGDEDSEQDFGDSEEEYNTEDEQEYETFKRNNGYEEKQRQYEKQQAELLARQQKKREQQKLPEVTPADKPIILYLDSLNEPQDQHMDALREYLELEFLDKKLTDQSHKKFFTDAKYKWESTSWD